MSYEYVTFIEELGYEDPSELENEYDAYFDTYSSFDVDDYEYRQDMASGVFGRLN